MKGYFKNLKKKIVTKRYLENYVAGVQFLIQNGDGINIKEMLKGITGLRESQEFKDKISKCLDSKGVNGFSSLMFAATKEDLSMGNLSIKKGVDVNKKDNAGYTALMYACRFNDGLDFVKMLLRNNAHMDIATEDGKTAVDFARYNKNTQLINLLCKQDIKPQDIMLTVEQYLGMNDKDKAICEVLDNFEDEEQRTKIQQFLFDMRNEIQQVRIKQLNDSTVIIDPIKDYDNYSKYISHNEFINLKTPVLYNCVTKEKMHLPEKPIKGVNVPTKSEYKMKQKYEIGNKISGVLQRVQQNEKIKSELKFSNNDMLNFDVSQKYLDII